MNLIHRQVDSLDVPNAPIGPAAPRPERAPTWLWLVAIVAVCLFGATLVVLLYPFVQALLREFDAALVEYAGVIRLALVGAVVLVILIAVMRLYHWAQAGAFLRLENQHPMHRQDLRAHVAPAVPSLLGRHYDVLEAEAGNPTRNVVTYGPHSSWSYRYDTNETGAPPIEALPEQPAPALPAFEAGRPVLQQLYDRGHVVRSGSSLLVGFAEGGVPQYIEMPGCGFVFVGGQPRSGKTTLVKLLMRFYEVDEGEICIDGQNVKQFTRADVRQMFGMVLQDTWLFNGSVLENIHYGRADATEAEVIAAAQAAHVDHFIRTLPDGYGFVLNEEVTNISQGQKQLLTIARAFLADSPMLILDEATSSVDTHTELLIQKAMGNLMTGRTSFIIAHRLSTIRNADLILVMRDGNIVEQGAHDELLASNGFYAELYNSQFERSDLEEGVLV